MFDPETVAWPIPCPTNPLLYCWAHSNILAFYRTQYKGQGKIDYLTIQAVLTVI